MAVPKPSLALLVSSAAYIVSGFGLTVVLARVLEPASFGAYGIVTAVLSVVNLVVSRGVPVAATRAIASGKGAMDATLGAAWRATLSIAFFVVIVSLLAAGPLSSRLDADLLDPLRIGSIAAVTFAVQALALVRPNARRDFVWLAVNRISYSLLRVVLIVAGAWWWGLDGAIVGYVLAPLAASLPVLGRSRQDGDSHEAGTAPSMGALARQSAPLLLTSAWVSLLLTIDLVVLRGAVDAHTTGVYAAAGALAHVTFYLLSLLPTETISHVSAASDARERADVAGSVADDCVLLVTPSTLLLVLAGPQLLDLIYGNAYTDGRMLVAPLAIATAAVTIHALFTSIDAAWHRQRVTVVLGATATALLGILVPRAGSEWGALGAAWVAATVCTALVATHWTYALAQRRVRAPRPATVLRLASFALAAIIANVAPAPIVVATAMAATTATTIPAARRMLSRA